MRELSREEVEDIAVELLVEKLIADEAESSVYTLDVLGPSGVGRYYVTVSRQHPYGIREDLYRWSRRPAFWIGAAAGFWAFLAVYLLIEWMTP